jgi:hypothetical protein
VNRSLQALPNFNKELNGQIKEIAAWKARVRNATTPLPLDAYAGTYGNDIYGTMTITASGGQLSVRFNSHKDLTAQLSYMDNDEWLLQYANIEYGIFAVRFKTVGQKVVSVDMRANEFVEYDPYTFTRK